MEHLVFFDTAQKVEDLIEVLERNVGGDECDLGPFIGFRTIEETEPYKDVNDKIFKITIQIEEVK